MLHMKCWSYFVTLCHNCIRGDAVPNLHSVIHLTRCVGFENMNGHIKLHHHGCKNLLPSQVNAVTMKYSVVLNSCQRPKAHKYFSFVVEKRNVMKGHWENV